MGGAALGGAVLGGAPPAFGFRSISPTVWPCSPSELNPPPPLFVPAAFNDLAKTLSKVKIQKTNAHDIGTNRAK